ncbi:MAG TPA: GMC family oxidoreductase N-terminal domain-containing protein [Ramlibacter sp.]|nr:GMC family oxidoreductase N-terminal domain-containing protein [Ramlibacter sp.]
MNTAAGEAQGLRCDFLVVGGGTAGCVLAARLSESGEHQVILVEAGEDTPPDRTPADIRDTFPASTLNRAYLWPGLLATAGPGMPARPYPQARVMGGGSSVMGMIALRGVPADYERWRSLGAERLGWQDAVRYFEKVEALGGGGPQENGRAVAITPQSRWAPFVHGLAKAARRHGLPRVSAINEAPHDGFFAMPVSTAGPVRASAAHCYLTAQVRARDNLRILSRTQVLRVNLEGRTALGVQARGEAGDYPITARKVVLCAGGIHSPSLLMRSGIGPGAQLQRLGIAPALDLAGVGSNLQNHAYSFFALTLPPGRRLEAAQRLFAVAGLRASSGLPECPGDLLAFVLGRSSTAAFGTSVAMVASSLYCPYSRGRVTLAGPEHDRPPTIEFNFLSDPRDRPRALQASRLAEALVRAEEVAAEYGEAYLLPAGLAVNQFHRQGIAGALLGKAAQIALDAPAPLRRFLVQCALPGAKRLMSRGRAVDLSDEDLLNALAPMGHPAGSCAMGRPGDPMAVVDSGHRVLGVGNLFIVDASVMPHIPSTNTNLPTMMLAEHGAERLLERR